MSGIYIHVPFCKQACSYCDFYFVTRQELKQDYVNALLKEIGSYQEHAFSSMPVETLYFGGGTPSLLSPEQLSSILDKLRSVFFLELSETTIEMNPDDVRPEYLSSLRDLGFNRISMGVQSFNKNLLKFMNRSHTAEEAHRALQWIKDSRFPVYTADLIYGNPGQSLDELNEDLNQFMKYDPPHISAYNLTIEPGTRLGKQMELGRLQPPDDEQTEQHFDRIRERLSDQGIEQYEVSNFARPGKEAQHNSSYWRHQNYLGLGPGAHSFMWMGSEDAGQRWSNAKDIRAYISGKYRSEETETLNLLQLAEERLMMGLRTKEGISFKEMRSRYGYELQTEQQIYIDRMAGSGRITRSEQGISLTPQGLKLADMIVLDLITLRKQQAHR